jgi:hypothetical protein
MALSPARAVTFDPFALPPEDFPFRIASKHSGLCWDVPGGNIVPGQALQQWFCHTGTNQNWNIVRMWDPNSRRDFLLIRNAAQPDFCAGVRQGGVILDKCDRPEGTLLEWRMDRRTGFLVFQIVALRTAGCFDVRGGTMSEGGALQLFDPCHGGLNQSWVLLPSR